MVLVSWWSGGVVVGLCASGVPGDCFGGRGWFALVGFVRCAASLFDYDRVRRNRLGDGYVFLAPPLVGGRLCRGSPKILGFVLCVFGVYFWAVA